ncbi:hypothetical protein [Echinimonas agarilytica]|uniref:Uncharacterized protein n=1 Tax=Echinimonas agarilytica TaxID=1215918 RepID=A0AA42B7Q3_9GAMM|nr:hypothetical protein [Echinimonas agarilytica]MCM2680455.1 hypothetical protein [Echinimonas agarilytica]
MTFIWAVALFWRDFSAQREKGGGGQSGPVYDNQANKKDISCRKSNKDVAVSP